MNWIKRFIIALISDELNQINNRIDQAFDLINVLADQIISLTSRVDAIEDEDPEYISRILKLEYLMKYHVQQTITEKSLSVPKPF
jgi:hypothetical protein